MYVLLSLMSNLVIQICSDILRQCMHGGDVEQWKIGMYVWRWRTLLLCQESNVAEIVIADVFSRRMLLQKCMLIVCGYVFHIDQVLNLVVAIGFGASKIVLRNCIQRWWCLIVFVVLYIPLHFGFWWWSFGNTLFMTSTSLCQVGSCFCTSETCLRAEVRGYYHFGSIRHWMFLFFYSSDCNAWFDRWNILERNHVED